MNRWHLVGGLAVILSASAAFADSNEHDGFYLRMHLGPAYFSGSSNNDMTIKGGAGTFGLAVGGAPVRNLIVFGEVFDDIALNPDLEAGGLTTSTDDVSSGMTGIGAGVAYYLMPHNVYFSASLSATRIVIDVHDSGFSGPDGATEFGLGTNILIGKEWWLSPNWGMGVAAQFAAAGLMHDDNDTTWHSIAGGVVLSATYN